MFAGFWPIELAFPDQTDAAKDAAMRAAPLWVLVPVLILVEMGEALVWTVLFTEGFARVLRAPFAGALCGVFAYSVLFHSAGGMVAVVASGWLVTVVSGIYLAMRERSRRAAVLTAIGIKWVFGAYAFVSIRGFA